MRTHCTGSTLLKNLRNGYTPTRAIAQTEIIPGTQDPGTDTPPEATSKNNTCTHDHLSKRNSNRGLIETHVRESRYSKEEPEKATIKKTFHWLQKIEIKAVGGTSLCNCTS